MLLLLLSVAAISLLFFLLLEWRSKSKMLTTSMTLVDHPPGPRGLPVIGNLHQFDPKKTHLHFLQLSEKYGPLVYMRLGFVPTIVVSSPKLAKEVLKTQDSVFCSRPPFAGLQKLSYNGLDLAFAPYSEYWKEMKKVCVAHLFSSKRVQSSSWIREQEVSRMMHTISSLSKESELVDLSKLVLSLTNSIICRIGFGKNYSNDETYASRFQGLLRETQAAFAGFFFSDYFPLMGWVDRLTGASKKLESVFRQLDEFYEDAINEHLDSHRKESEQFQDAIDVLLQLREEHKMSFDFTLDHIKAVLMNIFVAGTDTNAAPIVWAMTELMKNPNAMIKLQEEIRNWVKDQEGDIILIREEQLHDLTYLKAVVKETLRLHPPGPRLVPRQTMRKCSLGGRYQIEPGTLVFVNIWAIGRDPESWENPETFLPERFLGSPIDYKGQDFELIPFGAGRRGCPGMMLGATTIELTLANLLCFFDWELPASMKSEDIDMDSLPGLTAHKKHALCLNARNFISLH